MKYALTLIVALSSSLALAGQGSFECSLVNPKAKNAPATSFTLQQLSKEPLKEGTPSKFLLSYTAAGQLKHVPVTVTTEDVMVEWKGPKGSGIEGILFLDEDDQTSLTIGAKEGRYKCDGSY